MCEIMRLRFRAIAVACPKMGGLMQHNKTRAVVLAATVFVAGVLMLPVAMSAQVTVCHGQDNCQTVSPSGTVQWDEERARQKTIREARDHAYSAMSACNLANEPQLCRDTARALVAALVRTAGN
jgi:hypothetical protein